MKNGDGEEDSDQNPKPAGEISYLYAHAQAKFVCWKKFVWRTESCDTWSCPNLGRPLIEFRKQRFDLILIRSFSHIGKINVTGCPPSRVRPDTHFSLDNGPVSVRQTSRAKFTFGSLAVKNHSRKQNFKLKFRSENLFVFICRVFSTYCLTWFRRLLSRLLWFVFSKPLTKTMTTNWILER